MDDPEKLELIRWAKQKKADAQEDAEVYKKRSSPEMWRALSHEAVAYQKLIDKLLTML